MDMQILHHIGEGRILTADNRESFIRSLPALCGKTKTWNLQSTESDPMTIEGEVEFGEKQRYIQKFFVLYNTKPTWVKDGQWCFIATDQHFSAFVLAWRVGRSTREPHLTWFAFADPNTVKKQAMLGDMSQFQLRLQYQCLMLDAPLACSQRDQRFLMGLLGEPRKVAEDVIELE